MLKHYDLEFDFFTRRRRSQKWRRTNFQNRIYQSGQWKNQKVFLIDGETQHAATLLLNCQRYSYEAELENMQAMQYCPYKAW